MRIFIDENIPTMTLRQLQDMGHDVRDVRGTDDEGKPDDFLWQWSQQEKRLFISTDTGFMCYRNESHHGILIIRLKKPNRQKIHERVIKAVKRFGSEEWPGLLIVMQEKVQRIWRAKRQ